MILVLAACHVFDDVAIECTDDMPCAASGDTGVEPDTGEDTGPGEDLPSVGWAISMYSDAGRVRVYEPVTGQFSGEWTDLGEVHGPLAWDAATNTGVVAGQTEVAILHADETATLLGEVLPSAATDAASVAGTVYVSVADDVFTVDTAAKAVASAIGAGSFSDLRYLGGGTDVAFLVDLQSGSPDLYSFAQSLDVVAADFDYTGSRANVFAGPGGVAHGCTQHGAIYDLGALAGGNERAVAVPQIDADDVTDCAYDAAIGAWLVFSPTAGVVRLDRYGVSTSVYKPPGGYDIARASFFSGG